MSIYDEPKIDCHCHILDPARHPYEPDTRYRPSGQEIGTAGQMRQVFAAYGVRHALVVQPNSGYGHDNRCLLEALAASAGHWKGVAVVPLDIGLDDLAALQAQGIVGVAINTSLMGVDHYLGADALMAKLVDLGLFLNIQAEDDQLAGLLPLIEPRPVRLLIDHCGRPNAEAGIGQPGFQALLALGRSGRAAVKLSGYAKFARTPHPFPDAMPFVRALVDAFTLDRCVWASDWPYLKAAERVDYGPLLKLAESVFPDPADRRKLFWDTPRRLFGFAGAA